MYILYLHSYLLLYLYLYLFLHLYSNLFRFYKYLCEITLCRFCISWHTHPHSHWRTCSPCQSPLAAQRYKIAMGNTKLPQKVQNQNVGMYCDETDLYQEHVPSLPTPRPGSPHPLQEPLPIVLG